MITISISPFKALDKAYYRHKPNRKEFDNFKSQLLILIKSINNDEGEEHNKTHLNYFLKNTFYKDYYVNTKDRTDLAVYLGKTAKDKIGIIIETKKPTEKYYMVRKNNLNAKAMHEVILYYLRERIEEKNDEIKHIIITNAYEWFIFNATEFEKLFYKNKGLVKDYEKWKTDKKVSSLTDHFYNEIAKKYIDENKDEIHFIHFDLRDYSKILNSVNAGDEKKLIPLFKIFSTTHLLKESFLNDSNSLNKQFYQELLHIIGLEETKVKNKKIIGRKQAGSRDSGALIENTIRILDNDDTLSSIENPDSYGENKEERIFNIALELNITWINRVLFLKLLEAQLVNYHRGDNDFKFLDTKTIAEYDDLYELFHEVLAKKIEDRNADLIYKFKNIPYLNSSLFEQSDLEKKAIRISNLKDRFVLPLYKQSVLRNNASKPAEKLHTLEYLLLFLNAYDFASEAAGDIQEENKNLINASVLGRIFEKINGYKEGSFFTPGFITMYMAKETLRRTVLQKFNDAKGWKCNSFDELKDKITDRKEANEIINSLKICDPAVGSGHFLVSALNELLAIKSDLDVLCYRDGTRIKYYKVEVANDELSVYDEEAGEFFEYTVNEKGVPPEEKQKLQETLFHEKETIIENCLFGVDINPNSVNICRLRLWIELLKNAYYDLTPSPSPYQGEGGFSRVRLELVTLPNIDINIKQGNSLISRFDINDDYSKLPIHVKNNIKYAAQKYKDQVLIYKNTDDKETRNKASQEIKNLKKLFAEFANPTDKDYILLKKKESELGEMPLLFDRNEKEEFDKKATKLAAEVNELRTKYEEKQKTIYGNAFEWRFEFPEVLDEEGKFIGFDVVIGNPPYGRYLSISDSQKEELKKIDILGPTGDIAEFFINRMIKYIIREGTQFSFIVPKGLSYVSSWVKVRNEFLERFNIYNFIDTSKAFDEALYEMLIFHVELAKDKLPFIKCGYLSNEKKEIFQLKRKYYNERIFYLGFPQNYMTILEKISKSCEPVKNYMDYWYGKGGLTPEINKAHKGYQLLTGKEILQYGFKENIEKWYIGKEYLSEEDIEKKNLDKVVVQDIVAHIMNPVPHIKITAALDTEKRFCLNTVMCFAENNSGFKNKTLLGLLNSKFISFYYYYFIFNQAIRTMHFMPGYADELPVPQNLLEQQKSLIELVDKILNMKKINPSSDKSDLEKEIDRLVYKLYGLTEEEIRIVENV